MTSNGKIKMTKTDVAAIVGRRHCFGACPRSDTDPACTGGITMCIPSGCRGTCEAETL